MKELPSTFKGTTGVSSPTVAGLIENGNLRKPAKAEAALAGA
jgi:hypothetical protein